MVWDIGSIGAGAVSSATQGARQIAQGVAAAPPGATDQARGQLATGMGIKAIVAQAKALRELREQAAAWKQLQAEKEALAGAARAQGNEQSAEQLQAEAEFSGATAKAMLDANQRKGLWTIGATVAAAAAFAYFTK